MKLLLPLVLLLAACPHPTPPPNPPPGQLTCRDACKRMEELKCPAAKPTPEGSTCLDLCENAQSSELIVWKLDCMVSATSCDALDTCTVVKGSP